MSQYPTNPSGANNAPAGSGQLVLVGAVLAVVAVILMNVYVEMRVAAQEEEMITLFKFAGDLEAGDRIDASDLVTFKIPASMENAFGRDAIREDRRGSGRPADGLGFTLNVDVVEEEVLKSSQFLDTGRRANRNDPDIGERQIALDIDSDEQPADLTPGDRIDLVGAIKMSRDIQFETVMEYVEIAAVGERRSESGGGGRASRYGKITINTTLEQYKMLKAIEAKLVDQKFIIALRARNDTATPETGGEAIINPKVIDLLQLK